MAFALAGDILYIVLDILGDQRDYNSLYQCAITSRCFTGHALQVLYKLYNTSPVRGGGTEDEQFKPRRTATTLAHMRSQQDAIIRKWAVMWRSITLSALDQTYLPYSSYIRYLDLEDLGYLLGQAYIKKNREAFYTPELDDFLSQGYEIKGNKRLRSSSKFDHEHALAKMGSAIVKRSTSIRGMSCNVQPSLLAEFLQQLPLLQTLTIWSGTSLTDHAGDKIHIYCPDLKQITIYSWQDQPSKNAEVDSEQFLNELRPNTLEYFELLSYSHLGPRSIRAMGSHLGSLIELKLTSLTIGAIAELPSLNSPPALKVLVLTDSVGTPPDERFYEVLGRVAEWIRSCKALRHLELRRFMDDALLLSKVLPDENIHLSSLSLTDYGIYAAHAFHEALSHQPTLQGLYLKGEGSEIPEFNELLVQAIVPLKNLRELELKGVSDGFTAEHLMTLTPFLPHLERLWVGGDWLCDDALEAFFCLSRLKSLVIHAFAQFTVQGLLNLIAQAGPGNRGLSLSILSSAYNTDINEENEKLIREVLKSKLDGSFDFALAQEEETEMDTEDEMTYE
ncbi:uncharacterized protein BDW43DRAFT_293748 [Aspergillus alliaceus]|uniref:uncharacterized protein n=1 Tax=Petromyces alliaceus TaxID=209559 RepID=UPI0012A5400A|nr:uncharacterized protein BDW43DRAFT_293748 [Aspergillus alliaceus]KAB8227581.1 hypothetical protein BDW43DRAFT_293748 [Aspergillus alliaceus]